MPLNIKLEDLVTRGKQAESDEDPEQAAKFYEQALKEQPVDPYPYERLMIIYRKLKRSRDELRVINTGLKNLRASNKQRQQKTVGRNSTIKTLSQALMKSSGLIDKKGNLLYEPEPIPKWEKRKSVVEKKLKK
ncbi:MAG TPA: hypothetical protein VEV83_22120 [Parafilimonas sp.]|nr:hypothetical protein [Parafilimonas sp.]